MTRIITGNFLRNSDPKEIVAGTWPEIERMLEEKYSAHFVQPKDQWRINETLLDRISRYNGLDKSRNKEKVLEEMKQDLQRSRTDFLRKIERFSHEEINDDYNLDDIPLFQTVFVKRLKLFYSKDDCGIVSFSILPARPYFSGSDEFYQGYDFDRAERDRQRKERFLDKVTDASSLVVSVDRVPNIGFGNLRQTYKQARKNLLRNLK